MPAQLSESIATGPHRLTLPDRTDGPLDVLVEVERALQATMAMASGLEDGPVCGRGPVILNAGRWPLDARQLEAIEQRLSDRGLTLISVAAENPTTRMAAAGLGLASASPLLTALDSEREAGTTAITEPTRPSAGSRRQTLKLHRGTLRAGDQLDAEGSLLLLGDVNPGATIRAGGHVLVWGRLRGTAHAGAAGDQAARIIALQLRPLQLRIADAVARGPEGVPPEGLAEEASLVDGVIQIRPAPPGWPLSD
ncbi:MAG: septum site-determining protein MinC [Cyanobacteriota bacterium]